MLGFIIVFFAVDNITEYQCIDIFYESIYIYREIFALVI